MTSSRAVRTCRTASGLTLRALGGRAATSHSALAAYESGHKAPSATTLDRILAACGYELQATPLLGPDLHGRGAELEEVLALADEFPARHAPTLSAPVFGRR